MNIKQFEIVGDLKLYKLIFFYYWIIKNEKKKKMENRKRKAEKWTSEYFEGEIVEVHQNMREINGKTNFRVQITI